VPSKAILGRFLPVMGQHIGSKREADSQQNAHFGIRSTVRYYLPYGRSVAAIVCRAFTAWKAVPRMLKLATLVYVRRSGQTLMLHRVKKSGDIHYGKWNGLGGKFEPGESPEACAIREVREESGLTLHNPELRGVLTFPQFRSGEDWYVFVYVAHSFSGTQIHSTEGQLAWIDDERLLDLPLWPGDRIFLPWLQQKRFFSGRFFYANGDLTAHEVVFYPFDREERSPQQPSSRNNGPEAAAPIDDSSCWLCGASVTRHQCKIVCTVCGFRRDCSDP